MFLRKQIKSGKEYWSLVHNFREGAKLKQLTLGIGNTPTLDGLDKIYRNTHWKLIKVKKSKVRLSANSPRAEELESKKKYFCSRLTNDVREEIYKNTPELANEYRRWKKRIAEKRRRASNRFWQKTDKIVGLLGESVKWKANARDMLGVSSEASATDIKHRYHQLVQVLHPDKNELFKNDSHLFKLITEAYKSILRDCENNQS